VQATTEKFFSKVAFLVKGFMLAKLHLMLVGLILYLAVALSYNPDEACALVAFQRSFATALLV
jgi:hypothetical protein